MDLTGKYLVTWMSDESWTKLTVVYRGGVLPRASGQ